MTPIFLHNTLGNKKEEFKPIKQDKVSMYNCGPTVYNYAHIGNLRSYVFADTLRRMFEYNGYKVDEVMNITDVDDKTIKRSIDEGMSLKSLTKKYEDLFFSDISTLNIIKPEKTPRATESIADMISLIEKMLKNGTAYKSSDGVYFNIMKSSGYGTLANLNLENATKERIANDEYDKSNPRDFSLWKFYSKEDGDVCYDALFGKGRPGWHIECSAMSMKNLSETIDVHTGGSDLIFPHHTNEIAQSEAVTGKTFVHYWIHGGFITINGKKMSKSFGNIFTLQTLKEKNVESLAYRYFVLGAHYSSMLNFTWEAVEGAQIAWKKLRDFVSRVSLDTHAPKTVVDMNHTNLAIFQKYRTQFIEYINDDLDMPKALALIWKIVKDENISDADKKELILDFDKVLGLKLDEKEEFEIPENVKNLIKERDLARNSKDFAKSDKIRKKIEEFGFEVKDTLEGTVITSN